jgi:hypothetical protein
LRLAFRIGFQLHLASGFAVQVEDFYFHSARDHIELSIGVEVEAARRLPGRSLLETPERLAFEPGHPDHSILPGGHESFSRFIDSQAKCSALALLAGLLQGIGLGQLVGRGNAKHAQPVLIDAVEVARETRGHIGGSIPLNGIAHQKVGYVSES